MAEPTPVERDVPLDQPETRRFSRRSFVKGCMYAGVAGVAAVSAAAAFVPVSAQSKTTAKRVEYIGSTLISGPAPQGIPLFPLKAASNGDLSINPNPDGLKGGVLDWYKYCSHEKTTGLQADYRPPDENIRYFLTEEKKASTVEGWYLDKLGKVVNIHDFDKIGRGAGFNWRSQGATGKNIITGIVIKIDPNAMEFTNANEDLVRNQFLVPTPDGGAMIAYSSFCKHFCCVPGWHESALAQAQGYFDKIFCTCHFSTYDPYLIKGDFFVLQLESAKGGA